MIVVVIWQCDPALLLANTMTTGGDTGAHFGLAQFLKTNLLPHGHVTGWFPGAYDGLPLNTFYFPLPDTLAAVLGYVIPFDIAFKFVTILGSITLPIAAWAFGRLVGMERPRPAVLAVFTLPFLFDQTFTIYGGNLYSTMAGEYAFSLGLSFALVFLGVVIRGMRTGRSRIPAVILLSACVLCHLVPTLFCFVGAGAALILFGPTRRRLWWLASVIGTSFLLVAWWAVPFVMEQAYSTTMGWQNVTTYRALLMPVADRWALILGIVGMVIACVRFNRTVLMLAVSGVAAALFVRFAPQSALYNTPRPAHLLAVRLPDRRLRRGGAVDHGGSGMAEPAQRLAVDATGRCPAMAVPGGPDPGLRHGRARCRPSPPMSCPARDARPRRI